jgi:hypothetical protein
VIRGSISQSLNGAGGLVSSAGYETAAVYDEQVWNIVRAVILVSHGALRIVSHTACPHEMSSSGGVLNGECPFVQSAGSIKQFHGTLAEELPRAEMRKRGMDAMLARYFYEEEENEHLLSNSSSSTVRHESYL